MLSYRTEGPIAYATLDRPEKLNAMTRSFWDDLHRVLDQAERDDAVRVLIFHGAGRCFSVGGDIEGFGELSGAARQARVPARGDERDAGGRHASPSRRSRPSTATRSAAAAS